jgi:hypothetical protein
MGYRSDVAYIIKFKSFDDREAFISLMLSKNDPNIYQAVNETKHDYKEEPLITFEADDVKWYPDFPDVQAHEQLYKDAHQYFEADYRFLAIGEDGTETFDEIDNNGFGLYDYIYAVHRLATNFGE